VNKYNFGLFAYVKRCHTYGHMLRKPKIHKNVNEGKERKGEREREYRNSIE
jgi:hypothetical protein